MCQKLLKDARESFDVANYPVSLENLEKVMKMDEGYNDGAAMLLLAQTFLLFFVILRLSFSGRRIIGILCCT